MAQPPDQAFKDALTVIQSGNTDATTVWFGTLRPIVAQNPNNDPAAVRDVEIVDNAIAEIQANLDAIKAVADRHLPGQ